MDGKRVCNKRIQPTHRILSNRRSLFTKILSNISKDNSLYYRAKIERERVKESKTITNYIKRRTGYSSCRWEEVQRGLCLDSSLALLWLEDSIRSRILYKDMIYIEME